MDYNIALITLHYNILHCSTFQYSILHYIQQTLSKHTKQHTKKEDSTARHYKVWGKAARQIQEDK